MILERFFFTPIGSYPVISGIFVLVIFIITVRIFWKAWVRYVRYQWYRKNGKWTLLEIILPDEITRSPEAMELVILNGMWWTKGGGGGNMYKGYWKGEMLYTYSLEIASFGGDIHFYIQAPTSLKDLVQSQMYAQYPQVELKEVPDYVDRIPPRLRDETGIAMFSNDYRLSKPDAYPIKTYRDWKLDMKVEGLDPEQQIDPMNSMLEKIATIDPWEELWVQIVIRAQKDDSWRKEGEKIVDEIITKHRRVKVKEDANASTPMVLTDSEKAMVNAIENTLDKQAFEVGIRALFLTRTPNNFNVTRISFMKDLFASFNTESLNQLKWTNPDGFDNPWEDYNTMIEYFQKDRGLEKYRRRWFFNEKPVQSDFRDVLLGLINRYKRETFTMTTEELATIFHLPGRSYQTPNISRTDMKKSQPPLNLPIG